VGTPLYFIDLIYAFATIVVATKLARKRRCMKVCINERILKPEDINKNKNKIIIIIIFSRSYKSYNISLLEQYFKS